MYLPIFFQQKAGIVPSIDQISAFLNFFLSPKAFRPDNKHNGDENNKS